jgi:hypothetical protein
VGQDSAALTFSGYAEIYYGYDFDKPVNHERPFFIYNHKRHNEVAVNLAYAKANYSTNKIRSNLALMAGTYTQYNLAAEPEVLRFIYEANVGVKLSRKHNVWLDAGIMPSHIGFESAVSADCWTPSRSILAENSPYFETGIKLTSTTKEDNFFISLLLLNGWQRIERPEGINRPSFGLQLNYKYKNNLTFNYSNFIGMDKPDSLHALRTYHNLYGIFQTGKWGLIGGLDIGTDKNINNKYACWFSPVVIVKRTLAGHSFMALRTEYFNDEKQALLVTNTANGFKTLGLSINYDYWIAKNVTVCVEGKGFFASDKIFKQNKEYNNYALLTALCIKL